MKARRRLDLDDFPDSPYAEELRRGISVRSFAPPVEAEYQVTHLERVHRRVKLWFAILLLLVPVFAIDLARTHGIDSFRFLIQALLVAPWTLVLAVVAWTRYYERLYFPLARVLVPIISVPAGLLVAHAAVEQGEQQIAGLVFNLMGVFFFAGLMFRPALLTAVGMLAAFTGTAIYYQLPPSITFNGTVMLSLATFLAAVVSRDVEVSYRKGFLESALIEELVARDGLTGLMNRRAFDEHLLRIWQHGLRDKRSLAVLMIDIDHFKGYNDTYGHQAGDDALRSVAQTLKGFARRPLDLAARYGGEEFAIILYDLPSPYPQQMAEQMRLAVENLGIANHAAAEGGVVTISIGVGILEPALGRTPQGAIQLADEALYAAKQAGRNRFVMRGAEEYNQLATGNFTVLSLGHSKR